MSKGNKGMRNVAVAVIGLALGDLVFTTEGTSRISAWRQKARRREAQEFFSFSNEDLPFWCGLVGIDPAALVNYIQENYDRPEFTQRITESASVAMLLFGEDARAKPAELCGDTTNCDLGEPEEDEETGICGM